MSLIANGAGESAKSFYNGVATQSLRFDDGSSHKLTRTFSGDADNAKKMTISVWAKRGNLSGSSQVIIANYNSVRFLGELMWSDDNKISFDPGGNASGSSNSYAVRTTALFRDVSSWYHIVLAYDSTQGTDTNRVKIYVNGEQQTVAAISGHTFPPEDYLHLYSYQGANNTIGEYGANFNSGYLDGYLSEFNFIDGLALAPTSFGETKNGVWIAKEYTGNYGSNGYRLQFDQVGLGTASTSTIGADTSGNNNHWTSSGIAAHDCAMPDSPENNFPVMNPLAKSTSLPHFTEGNLKLAPNAGNYNMAFSNMGVSSGKFYYEFGITGTTNSGDMAGIIDLAGIDYSNNNTTHIGVKGYAYYPNSGNAIGLGTSGSYGATYGNGDVIGVALDLDAGKVWFAKNGTYQASGNPAGGSGEAFSSLSGTFFAGATLYAGGFSAVIFNFGQDGSFAGTETAQGNTDENGIGNFYYAPPSGFLAICTANLPEPAIGPNSDTQADDNFNTVIYSGNGTDDRGITGVGFKPDWVWLRSRSNDDNNVLNDSSRGGNKQLFSNNTDAELSATSLLKTFNSDGFTLGTDNAVNGSGRTYVSWNWKANGGTTSSNSNGSITSTVQANVAAGLSIILYAGNSTKGATIGHGLSATPEMVWFKRRNAEAGWAVYNKDLTDNGYALLLNSTAAQDNRNTQFLNETSPSSTLITLGDWNEANAGSNYVAYAFHSVEGYSKIGSYTANASTDGPFVYTGFKPAWLLIKAKNGTQNWNMYDNKRRTFNPNDIELYADLGAGSSAVEYDSGRDLDFLANGFKLRMVNHMNVSGQENIYMAFAEAPFKYANAI